MTTLDLKFATKSPTFAPNRVFVVGVVKKGKELALAGTLTDTLSLRHLNLETLAASDRAEHVVRVPGPKGSTFALIGLGGEQPTRDSLRELGGAIARQLGDFREIIIDLPVAGAEVSLALAEGALLGNYRFDGYKASDKSARVNKIQTLVVLTEDRPSKNDVTNMQSGVVAVHFARDLVNTPANDLYPATFVKAAQKALKDLPLTVEIWDEKKLKADGFGGIYAVGQGSSRPPRLLKIGYQPKGAKRHLALVGKGITFDTGGLSLKPGEAMVGMKYDMTGAASSLAATIALAKQGARVRVTTWLCLAENMPSGTAQRPNDIIKVRNGKTIEVLNTDAEGRLVLADGLSAASEEHPDLIVDVATLTGAAVIALGNRYAGVMGDDQAVSQVEAAAALAGEKVWHMPLPTELRLLLNSDIADIANVKIGNRSGGMLVGGHFLKEFIGKTKDGKGSIPWAHIDIAGPSDNSGSAYGYIPKGATGTIVRTLINLAAAQANQ